MVGSLTEINIQGNNLVPTGAMAVCYYLRKAGITTCMMARYSYQTSQSLLPHVALHEPCKGLALPFPVNHCNS